MQRGSDKHSPRVDEALEAEVRGMMTAGRETRAEEWNTAEPSGEDQPRVDLVPEGSRAGGLPGDMSEADLTGRSELATFLGKECWPGDASALLAKATELQAPDRVLARLGQLPAGVHFRNVQEVWSALHGQAEPHRF